ncbi:2-oxoglutarate and iron-dependent oxygenase domain-containing protein 3 [Pieris rapae]|uniref:2-oxoglutarate and iron-dependent oxygenase domain-containing protein 3 n=1 Tax=Pieris rapae TaxID=64459 RepID=UPI001E27B032|nr:2-oxoglutarate and iron-dependent oxygenase domain-containing protein 3 [Pieris rapae]
MNDLKRRGKLLKKTDTVNELNSKDNNKGKHKPSIPKGLPLRVLSRGVVIVSLLIVVYFTSKDELRTFARQNEVLSGKVQPLQCSPQYLKEVNSYDGCVPKTCKRFVFDTVVSLTEVEGLLAIAKKGLRHGRSLGGASVIDLHSGAMSKGQGFINIYESNSMKNLFTEEDFNLYRSVKEKVKYTIANHFNVNADKIYLTHPTFISEMTSRNAVTKHDEYWHSHVDKETYPSFHYTSLVYLSDYNINFEGGRFVFIDEKYNTTIEPKKGRLSIFTSGHENLHFVEKVKSGVRYAMTIAFTCDKKQAIQDPSIDKYNIP